MSKQFPFSWEEWRAGVRDSYDVQAVLEAKRAMGLTLSPEEEHLLKTAMRVTRNYLPDGHRKFNNAAAKGASKRKDS
jgi:hypothetical protein